MLSRLIPLLAALAGLATTPGGLHAQVTLHYHERPPYVVLQNGELGGLTGQPAATAFAKAGIPFTLALTPSSRQLRVIQDNRGADCAVGWFKNAEREAFGKFSKPLYHDRPMIALTWSNNPKIRGAERIETLLANPYLRLLVKQGYSYGTLLDKLIATFHPQMASVSVENTQMLRIIHAKRADYMFVAPEEADGLIAASGLPASSFGKIALANAPAGEYRHLLCSKRVPDEWMDRLNDAIR